MNRDYSFDLGFTTEQLPNVCHVCLIYEDENVQKSVVSEYLAAGIRSREQVRYLTDRSAAELIKSWLSDAGVDYADAEQSQAFYIALAERAYYPNGSFVPHVPIDMAIQRYDAAKAAGYPAIRSCGEMSWALRTIPGVERWLEYEALLNTIDHSFPHIGMCQYDARLFDGATLYKVLQVHPYVISQGQIVRNPFYIRPEEFLGSLKESANTTSVRTRAL